MIPGEVTPNREAVIPIPLRPPSGQEVEVEAVVDTGFTGFMTLPAPLVASWSLPYRSSTQYTLADGGTVSLHTYRVTVVWDGSPRVIPVLATGTGPLVGMALLYGSRVTLDVVDGGPVTIEALP